MGAGHGLVALDDNVLGRSDLTQACGQMLGILGTVTGIMQTFGALNGADGVANPLAATAGIGEALITTAAGLIASLVLLFPYNILERHAED